MTDSQPHPPTAAAFHAEFASPLGPLKAFSDGEAVTVLRFTGRDRKKGLPDPPSSPAPDLPVFRALGKWLSVYFKGKDPGPSPAVNPEGAPFRKGVWELLPGIRYGRWVTYAALARAWSAKNGGAAMTARAVGGALGANPVPILIPCHRVLGNDGKLTGFAYGLDLKKALLELEGNKDWKP
ncbi:MAG: methylated-DNA--[protein]-cysteine S-methyltransferase [Deltaproteobacteria bacterium]|jgi:methylated-DNA-[protein]-cysteine S-methyltransferase|nr:methylated-DNA--[protein]-cysteine S-methyltransferase [Deltaproteobacteria bacterium]